MYCGKKKKLTGSEENRLFSQSTSVSRAIEMSPHNQRITDFSIESILRSKGPKDVPEQSVFPEKKGSWTLRDSSSLASSHYYQHPCWLANVIDLKMPPPDWVFRQHHAVKSVGRRRYTRQQTQALQQMLTQSLYVTQEQMETLAETTGLTRQQVKIWFQNQRLKMRKAVAKTSEGKKSHSV